MSIEDDKQQRANGLGYEARYFAHKHRISRLDANEIIRQIGPDRAKLDEAARELKRVRATGIIADAKATEEKVDVEAGKAENRDADAS